MQSQGTHDGHQHAHDTAQQGSGPDKLPGIHHIVAVGSGKGGVGKSTVAVHLALALQHRGSRVGLIDADVLGPSIPGMLGVVTGERPAIGPDGRVTPAVGYGLKMMSMGLFTGDDKPAVLRGPMVTKYLQMFVSGVSWGELDYLVLDLPPGTGDTQLTLAQTLPLSGAIIVTTPQDVSLKIARRGLRMFQTVHVPILGVIENMSTFTCPHCGESTDVFRRGGGERMSRELDVAFLGALPLDVDVVTAGDEGRPMFSDKSESITAKTYREIAARLDAALRGTAPVALRPFVWNWETNEGEPGWVETAVSPAGAPTSPVGFRRRDARTLSVLWQDGRADDFDVRDLRLACRCASCVEEMSGRPLLDPATVRLDVAPRVVNSVGNYAVAVDWNDGHSTGIYAFGPLRALGDRDRARVVEDV